MTLPKNRKSSRRLAPRGALLHPVWLGALLLMALNDHFLKGSGLLPGVITGKLSDFAGLMVAPLLLAVLVRVRGRSAWAAAHVAVGVVFAGIQLSVPFADGWSSLMGLVGFPWTITCDPTDLVALPVLFASYSFFPRVMRSTRSNAIGSVQWMAAAGGLATSVATSPPSPGPTLFFEDFNTDAYIHNANEFDIVVRIRPLAESADIDCTQVEADPGRLLTEPLFAEAQSWTLRANANVSVFQRNGGVDDAGRGCWAAWVDADNVEPFIMFWGDGAPRRPIAGEGLDESIDSWVAISHDDDGDGSWEAGREIAFEIPEFVPRPEGVCAPQSDNSRVLWSEMPVGTWFLGAVDEGLDGCYDLELRTGFEQDNGGGGRDWYLCLPSGSFPFREGERVSVGHASGGGVIVERLDPLVDVSSAESLQLLIRRGDDDLRLFELDAGFIPAFDCGLSVAENCGSVTRAGTVTVSGAGFPPSEARPSTGAPATLQGDDGTRIDIYVAHAEERFAIDPTCVEGPDTLGLDVELVAVRRGVNQED